MQLSRPITYDEHGLIVQSDGDGGDCAARTGQLVTGAFLAARPFSPSTGAYWFGTVRRKLEPANDGVLLRYYKAPYNTPYDGPFATSRDQTRPMLIAAGFMCDDAFVKRVFSKIKFGYYNRDLFGPEDLAIVIRSLYLSGTKLLALLWPLLLVCDLFTLLNSLIRVVATSIDQDDVGDWVNHIQVCTQAYIALPTPMSFLARKSAKRVRGGVQRTLDHYHRPETGGNPLNELWAPIVNRVFS